MTNLVKLTGMWSNENRDGERFLRGKTDKEKLREAVEKFGDELVMLIFKNGFKKKENDPDWVLYAGAPMQKEKPEQRDIF